MLTEITKCNNAKVSLFQTGQQKLMTLLLLREQKNTSRITAKAIMRFKPSTVYNTARS